MPRPGNYLEREFGVPHTTMPLPIGLADTDLFVSRMEELTGIGLARKV